ncbi:protein-glutamate O-methyltransferase CheR [Salicibibacter cibarius]|uniref:protein-glutamate O-methyltransferase n=1 Tax=Salicibibacter cibarius TaxID=2743000 RepID=A0A7T6Z2Y7_9BACI|nr:protein-glutamate O-methyltransferase CheR [Salicibibacter cibarius]QQK76014.1 protein-glutamate O-methyltransferase CheR [Salicibibacter cibarius]
MEEDYKYFKSAVLERTGIDLTLYKERQMKRRLESLYQRHRFLSFRAFFHEGMLKDPVLLQAFLDKMTINVSEFYRNKSRWDFFEEVVLPELLETRQKLKLWSAACSSGEEAYTVAIIASKHRDLSDVSIVATDIDAEALKKADVGFYKEISIREVPTEEMRYAFDLEADGYRIKSVFKEAIRFQNHNLLADPYPRGNDLIICRNILIYFTATAKDQIFRGFNDALKIGGFLFVGSTEQIFSPETYGFEHVGNFFYRKRWGL